LDTAESLDRVAGSATGHLATIRPDGRPHLVVITFAVAGSLVVTAIDDKPKTTQRLQRLANIEANPAVSFLVDHYDDDWEELWWVRVDGLASIHLDGETREMAIEALRVEYRQYRERPPRGPVIVITPERVSSWASNG
jgi:PPOX class probable F420-dependent enzyme